MGLKESKNGRVHSDPMADAAEPNVTPSQQTRLNSKQPPGKFPGGSVSHAASFVSRISRLFRGDTRSYESYCADRQVRLSATYTAPTMGLSQCNETCIGGDTNTMLAHQHTLAPGLDDSGCHSGSAVACA